MNTIKRRKEIWPPRKDYKELLRYLRYRDWRLVYRFVKQWYQYFTRGFSDDELWSLDATFADFMLPRLMRFREISCGYPGGLTEEKWNEYLDEMIFSLQFIVSGEVDEFTDKEHWKRAQDGFDLLGKYFFHLWF